MVHGRPRTRVILLLLLALPLFAAEFTFAPQQGVAPGGQNIWAVTACAEKQPLQVYGADIIAAAQKLGISVSTHSTVARLIEADRRTSPARVVLLALEITGYAATAALATESLKIKEKWKALFPTGSAGLRLADTLIRRENPDVSIPANYLPPLALVPAGSCGEWMVFGVAAAM